MIDHLAPALGLGALGLAIGPLLGIAVDRAVERERPAAEHRCRHCGAGLGTSSLVPIASWFVRCPNDSSHSRWRYPLTDVSVALAFVVAGLRFGTSFFLVPYLVVFAAFVVMAVIDLEEKLLLNILTYPTFAVAAFGMLVLSGPNDHDAGIWPALVGAGAYGVLLLAAFLAYPPGLGLGDVKLAPSLGLALGWVAVDSLTALRLVLYSLLASFLVMGVVGLAYGRITGAGRKAEVPAGPFLIAGAIALIALSDPGVVTGLSIVP